MPTATTSSPKNQPLSPRQCPQTAQEPRNHPSSPKNTTFFQRRQHKARSTMQLSNHIRIAQHPSFYHKASYIIILHGEEGRAFTQSTVNHLVKRHVTRRLQEKAHGSGGSLMQEEVSCRKKPRAGGKARWGAMQTSQHQPHALSGTHQRGKAHQPTPHPHKPLPTTLSLRDRP